MTVTRLPHPYQSREVAPSIAQGYGDAPTKAHVPEQREIHTYYNIKMIINSDIIREVIAGNFQGIKISHIK